MKGTLTSLLIIVVSIGTAHAEAPYTPDILDSVDKKSVEFMLTDERLDARGEFFKASWGKSAISKAREWCRGRGRCWTVRGAAGGLLTATAYDPQWWGIAVKSY
jgi:hypothetical protein